MATRKNASPNPALKNNNTGWGGGSTPTRSTGLSGLPRTTGAHYSVNSYASLPVIAAGAGETWTLSCYFQNNTGTNLGSKVVYFVCQKPGDDFSITTSVALPTGTTRVSITGVTLTGTTGLYMLIDSFNASLGSGVEITGVLFEKVGTLDTYFDGDDVGASWDGTNGNSSSTLTSGSDIIVPDPITGGGSSSGTTEGLALGDGNGAGSSGGTSDGRALGDGNGGGSSSGTTDGRALGDGNGGGSSGGQLDGLAVGDGSSSGSSGGSPDAPASGVAVTDGPQLGGGSGGQLDGRVLGDAVGGGGSGGSADTISAGPVTIADPVQRGGGSGGSADSVSAGSQVVHDQMVMPLALKARDCLVTEVGKLANPPLRVQIRPGATFQAMYDSANDECCQGIAYVRPGVRVPSSGAWPAPLNSVEGPSASRARASYYVVNLEVGIYRCVPTVSDQPESNDAFPTDAQWLQAAQDQADDGAALLRVVCCLQDQYGNDSVIAGPLTPLENSANCGGIIINVQLRAPACDCVD
jgi:hypothetical protein